MKGDIDIAYDLLLEPHLTIQRRFQFLTKPWKTSGLNEVRYIEGPKCLRKREGNIREKGKFIRIERKLRLKGLKTEFELRCGKENQKFYK